MAFLNFLQFWLNFSSLRPKLQKFSQDPSLKPKNLTLLLKTCAAHTYQNEYLPLVSSKSTAQLILIGSPRNSGFFQLQNSFEFGDQNLSPPKGIKELLGLLLL